MTDQIRQALRELRRRHDEDDLLVAELLWWIAEMQEVQMAAIDDLRSAVAELQSSVSAESDTLAQVATELATAEAQITQLQAQVASGAGVTEADLEGLAQQVTGVAQAAQAAVAELQQPPSPDPGPSPAPAPTPEPPAPTPPAAERTVYTFDGDPTAINPDVWLSTGLQTASSPPQTLYYFSGDVNPGDRNGDGVGGLWHAYDGPTQPVGAAGGEG